MTHRKNSPRFAVLIGSSQLEHWVNFLESESEPNRSPGSTRPRFYTYKGDGITRPKIYLAQSVEEVLAHSDVTLDAVLIDNREDQPSAGFSETLAGRSLPRLLAGGATGKMISRRSVMLILPQFEHTALHAYAAGSLQLGGIFVEPSTPQGVLEALCKNLVAATPGKVALCLAGGGIEGLLYEIGVLRALDAHLENKSLIDFDIFSGISAGAVLGAFLANGVQPKEIADAIHGKPSRIDPITRGMLFDPNIGEIVNRLGGAVRDMVRGDWLSEPITSAMRITPNAIFSGDKMRRYLEREFTRTGMSNSFEELDRELFVGVTDQDSGAHITFGEESYSDVSISSAVRASIAMTPYYGPEQINGRFYVDGIFTRTLNLDVAVARGAKMIICIDPMTPVQVNQPGYVSRRGGVFNTVQSIKAMVRTRLSELIGRAEETYPDVSIFVFSPTPHDMEQMSGTLMHFFFSAETEKMAFDSASRRIAQDFDWLAADLGRHGFKLKKNL